MNIPRNLIAAPYWVLGCWTCVSDLVGGARHLSPSAQEALRLRAVAALVAGRDLAKDPGEGRRR
ncbi:hypothetical protein GCM10022384_71000 [Streptomyces marokkonensis]|uniref:Uncharacterized protein n=1 Tax=Streptomyces marokkonensis TaxID=324855 RepID=A0ABP7T4G7_9ACTN